MSELIKKDGYLTFDALTLKQQIKDMLVRGGIFTDAQFEGSYISTLNDIISYTFSVLMYYLNKTSTEDMFSDAQIYENMNRVVKLLDYKPIGNQAATLSFLASAGTGVTNDPGLYTIPRYSYINVDGIFYSFNEDITFAKTLSAQLEELTDISNEKLLYQGQFIEYPIYDAIGQENEIVYLTPGQNIIIDHYNIYLFVKSSNGVWQSWDRTPSLYLEDANAKKFEIRFNENKIYEIKFGNDINGVKLQPNDKVAIYYLQSDGSNGEVGVGVLAGKSMIPYNTTQFNQIMTDVIAGQYEFLSDLSTLLFDNDSVSTFSNAEESVDSIRVNAPSTFRSQYRLVTTSDYEQYIKTNFANLIHDVKAVNNWQYLSEIMKYYFDLGLTNPNQISRVLYNQVLFGDACNFNNVYLITVPKTVSNIKSPMITLTPSQKELILSSMRSEKTLTSEVIVMDPVYVAIDLAMTGTTIPSENDISQTGLLVIKDPNSRRDNTSIQNDITNVFTNYFSRNSTTLGQMIDVKQLTANILAVQGVKTFYTQRLDDTSNRFEGLSLMVWNPIYSNDVNITVKNLLLPYFKYPYLNNKDTLSTRIIIQSESKIFENIEY